MVRHAPLADLIQALGVPRPLTPDEEFGVQLCVDRAKWRRIVEVGQGLSAALGGDDLPIEYMEAQCYSPETAATLCAAANTRRLAARIRGH